VEWISQNRSGLAIHLVVGGFDGKVDWMDDPSRKLGAPFNPRHCPDLLAFMSNYWETVMISDYLLLRYQR
jgi:hypothetical protein